MLIPCQAQVIYALYIIESNIVRHPFILSHVAGPGSRPGQAAAGQDGVYERERELQRSRPQLLHLFFDMTRYQPASYAGAFLTWKPHQTTIQSQFYYS